MSARCACQSGDLDVELRTQTLHWTARVDLAEGSPGFKLL